MIRWSTFALSILLLGCRPPPPEMATAEIRISVNEAAASPTLKVIEELQRLGFKEHQNPASQPRFRIFTIKIPEEYIVGIPLEPSPQSGKETVYFSGPRPFSNAGVALYRDLFASLTVRIGEKYVDSSASNSAGQLLIQGTSP